jgi:hypothetical protein
MLGGRRLACILFVDTLTFGFVFSAGCRPALVPDAPVTKLDSERRRIESPS